MKAIQIQLQGVKEGLTSTAVKITKKLALEMRAEAGLYNIPGCELREMTFAIADHPAYEGEHLVMVFTKKGFKDYRSIVHSSAIDFSQKTLKDFIK